MVGRPRDLGGHEPRAVQRALALLESAARLGSGATAKDIAALADIPEDQPMQRIRAFVRASGRHIDNDRAGWVVGARIFWSIDALADRDAVIPLRDQYEGRLRAEIDKAIAAGELVDQDSGMISRLILSWVNYTPRWHKPEGPLSVEDVVDQFLDVTLAGLRPR